MIHQWSDPAILVEGRFVSEKWERFAEILQDYDQYLELRWIPPEHRTNPEDKTKPYAIVHALPDRKPYIVMFASELDDPVDLLARIFAGDLSRQKNVLQMLDAKEAAQKAFELKADMDQREELADFAHFLMTNRSPYYTKVRHPYTGEKLKLDHNGRRL